MIFIHQEQNTVRDNDRRQLYNANGIESSSVRRHGDAEFVRQHRR